VRLLLDTHAFAWWNFGDARLPARARAAIEAADDVLVSAVVGYEIVAKHAAGRWADVAAKHAAGRWADVAALARDVAGAAAADGFIPLSVTLAHAAAAGRLPPHHRDPFDRILAAQALLEGLTLVSADPQFDAYGVPRLW
jgi:PIN domain nuclease of toxin-antitoxin system